MRSRGEPAGPLALLGERIDRIRVNRIERVERGGRPAWRKTRTRHAGWLLPAANLFFRCAGNPVRALVGREAWLAREIGVFALLHGEMGCARREGDSLVVPELPGEDLSRLLERGALEGEALRAAGRELRRAHGARDPREGGRYSHADPHLANFLYCPEEGRARLIDYEVLHREGLGERERFADDLLVFLQDMVGRIEGGLWLPSALAFLEGYGEKGTIREMARRLVLPGGIGRVWWAVRTTYMPGAVLRERLAALREKLGGEPV